MDNRASKRARHDAFDAYRAETIIYRGYPVRRGFALLLENEITGEIEPLIAVGQEPVTGEPAFPDSHARELIYGDIVDISRAQFSFDYPNWRS